MGEPEAIEAKFAHVHSERVWWLSVVVVVTCRFVISVCIHVHARACHVHVYVPFVRFLIIFFSVQGMY